ncbi:hypothetical protein ACFWMS_29510, partial [Peribacillus butanolivorans]|uniref:hypothetical protein n=1 Tax=Peribacillus butanolivorans TaxID=421767 RepID=UPI00364622A7
TTLDDVIAAPIGREAETVTGKVMALLESARSGEISRSKLSESLIELVSGQDNNESVAQFEAYLAVRRRPELSDPVQHIMQALEAATESALKAFGIDEPHVPARQFVALIDGFTLQEIARPGQLESRYALRDLMIRLLDSYLAG